jgi:hypothetical protein
MSSPLDPAPSCHFWLLVSISRQECVCPQVSDESSIRMDCTLADPDPEGRCDLRSVAHV